MAFQAIKNTWIGNPENNWLASASGGGFSGGTIDATGEMHAMVGRVWFAERTGTKAIRRVGFLLGAVTKAGGSALTVSLQNITATTGAPMQPDGTQDQTVAIANADAGFVSNTWYRTGALSADRTVSFGEQLAVVIEFDGAGRLGADAVQLLGVTGTSNPIYTKLLLKTGGTWATFNAHPTMVLEFDDGTFGQLDQERGPISAVAAVSYNSGSTPDEYAMPFTVPATVQVDAMSAIVFGVGGAGADFDLVLYEGTTVLETVSIDYNNYTSCWATGLFAKRTLVTGVTYYVAVKPTSTTNVRIEYFSVSDANHFACWPLGTGCNYATRTDGGAWSATTTRRLMAAVRICGIDDGAGGSGGVKIAQAMTGGFVG